MISIEKSAAQAGEFVLRTETTLRRPLDETFSFFADASNLETITPPELNFRIISTLPIAMRVGATIRYRLRLFGIPFSWTTEIPQWDPPYEFVDVQSSGPYAQWIHRHTFEETPDGTLVRDEVRYRLPFGRLGIIGHPLVARQLTRIFSFRLNAIRRNLDPSG